MAYEMLISDWSSDVCSSDLHSRHRLHCAGPDSARRDLRTWRLRFMGQLERAWRRGVSGRECARLSEFLHADGPQHRARPHLTGVHDRIADRLCDGLHPPDASEKTRSEAHTSELQSLMRISYAVFCLKK